MTDLYDGYSSTGDPGGGRDDTKFYAFDAKSHADAINALQHAQVLHGTRSSLPSASSANNGGIYFCDDCDAFYESKGTTWTKVKVGGFAGPPMADPPAFGSTLNSGSVSTDLDGRLLSIASSGASHAWRGEYQTLSPSSNYTVTAYIE